MFEAPLKLVVMTLLKSLRTGVPSANFSPEGTTVQPSRTPVNPAYLEKELTSIQQSRAPGISKIDLGTPGVRINGAYAASKTRMLPRSLQTRTASTS